MKPINEFTNEILQKSKRGKTKKNIINAIISVLTVCVLIFLVAYSNIITFNGFNNSNKYKRYMQSYQSSSGDASLKIIDDKTAVVTVSEKVYACNLKEESSYKFTLTEKNNNANFTVLFENEKANLSGEIKNNSISKTLNIVTDMSVSEGVYTMFARETNGEITSSYQNWFLINEKQSYVGEGVTAYTCDFISVGSKVLQRTRDQVSGLSEFSLFEVVPVEKFGFFAIKNTLYESENDVMGFVSYYKKIDESESFGYAGGEFQTELVTYENKTYKIDESEAVFDEGIKWRLNYIPSIEETFFKIKLNLLLNADGSCRFTSTETEADMIFKTSTLGKWYNLKRGVLVVLEKGFSVFDFKAFVISADNSAFSSGTFDETAKTNIYALACYKTGYHNFNYYVSDATATVYWGSNWTMEELRPNLLYDTEYVFSGWQSNWHNVGANFERNPITESKTTSIIFKNNGNCEVYRDGEFWLNVKYKLVEYDDGRFRIDFDGFVMLFDDNETKIKTLYVDAKRVEANRVSYKEVAGGDRLEQVTQYLFKVK